MNRGKGSAGDVTQEQFVPRSVYNFVSVKGKVSNRVSSDIMLTRIFNEVNWFVGLDFFFLISTVFEVVYMLASLSSVESVLY